MREANFTGLVLVLNANWYEIWNGDISGSMNYSYNADFLMESSNVNELADVSYQYDDDALPT
jgi:hypothetical protein